MSRRWAALLAAGLLALGAGACSGDDDEGGRSGDVPSGAVATVGEGELDEQVEALARAQRGSGAPGGDGSSGANGSSDGGGDADGEDPVAEQLREQLEAQALSRLVMRAALEQEAADRGVEVTDAEVRRRWNVASEGQFKTEQALRRFLGGQTLRDVLDQLRLQLLTERIHEQVAEQAGAGKQGAQAVRRFQQDFRDRWQARTACAEGHTAPGCADDDD